MADHINIGHCLAQSKKKIYIYIYPHFFYRGPPCSRPPTPFFFAAIFDFTDIKNVTEEGGKGRDRLVFYVDAVGN